MIFDMFPFNNEAELFELRVELLKHSVDKFVIQEVGETHSGKAKAMLVETLSRKLGVQDRVIIQTLPTFPVGLAPFERDWFQRNLATDFLKSKVSETDIVLYGDVDEIPNPRLVMELDEILRLDRYPFAAFAQEMNYCYFNYRESTGRLLSHLGEFKSVPRKQKKWIGTVAWSGWALKGKQPADLRNGLKIDLDNGIRLPNGGWHYSYVGGPGESAFERFKHKLMDSAHQEFNTEKTLKMFNRRIAAGLDPLGRRGVRFERVPSAEIPQEVRRLFASHPSRFI